MAHSSTPSPSSVRRPGTSAAVSSAAAERQARRSQPRNRLGLAVVMVMLGSFMPWVDTALGTVSGARGPGLWTFYAAMLGLAAALIPGPRLRRLAAAQAAIMAAVAIALPVWQVLHILTLVGTAGWFPGPGLVFVFSGGVLAASCAVRILRSE